MEYVAPSGGCVSKRNADFSEGGLRWRAADLLTDALGYRVYAENIRTVEGYYRSEDVYRWEAHTRQYSPESEGGVPHIYGCWLTLTVFVRYGEKYGVAIDKSARSYPLVWANLHPMKLPHGLDLRNDKSKEPYICDICKRSIAQVHGICNKCNNMYWTKKDRAKHEWWLKHWDGVGIYNH